MTETTHTADRGTAGPTDSSRTDEDVRYLSSPTTTPATIKLALVVLATALLLGLLVPRLGEDIRPGGRIVLLLLGGVLALRVLLKIYVLRQTRYVITTDGIRREFSLPLVHRSREIPLRELRGVEVTRSPAQSLLGYGTVDFLTGGTNTSLGFVTFEHVEDPTDVPGHIPEGGPLAQSSRESR